MGRKNLGSFGSPRIETVNRYFEHATIRVTHVSDGAELGINNRYTTNDWATSSVGRSNIGTMTRSTRSRFTKGITIARSYSEKPRSLLQGCADRRRDQPWPVNSCFSCTTTQPLNSPRLITTKVSTLSKS